MFPYQNFQTGKGALKLDVEFPHSRVCYFITLNIGRGVCPVEKSLISDHVCLFFDENRHYCTVLWGQTGGEKSAESAVRTFGKGEATLRFHDEK